MNSVAGTAAIFGPPATLSWPLKIQTKILSFNNPIRNIVEVDEPN
jgi:hypothetical protein